MSAVKKGITPKNFSEIQKLSWLRNRGRKHTEEHKRKIGLAGIGRRQTKETKRKLSEARIGAGNPMYGKGDRQLGVKNHQWKGGISKLPNYVSFNNRRQKVRRKGAIGSHTLQEWEDLKRKHNYTCLHCGKKEPEITLTVDHIIAIKLGGSHYIGNIQPLCTPCNMWKSTKAIDFVNNFDLAA